MSAIATATRPEAPATTVAPAQAQRPQTRAEWRDAVRRYRRHGDYDIAGRCPLCKVKGPCPTGLRLAELLRSNPATAHIPEEL